MNRFSTLLRLDSALNADDFGLIEKFHAEKVLGVNFLYSLIFFRNLIPGNFVVSVAVPRNVQLSFTVFVDALEN